MVGLTAIDAYTKKVQVEQRILRAKEFGQRLDIALRVAEDLPFWARRIMRAMKKGKNTTDNSWSFRGLETQSYIAELQNRLGEGFRVYFEVVGEYEEHRVRYIFVRW